MADWSAEQRISYSYPWGNVFGGSISLYWIMLEDVFKYNNYQTYAMTSVFCHDCMTISNITNIIYIRIYIYVYIYIHQDIIYLTTLVKLWWRQPKRQSIGSKLSHCHHMHLYRVSSFIQPTFQGAFSWHIRIKKYIGAIKMQLIGLPGVFLWVFTV